VRLHPLPEGTATVTARAEDPEELRRAVAALARLPLEADCFDARWERGGPGWLSLQFSGAAAGEQAARTSERVPLGYVTIDEDDDWSAHRELQRSRDGAV